MASTINTLVIALAAIGLFIEVVFRVVCMAKGESYPKSKIGNFMLWFWLVFAVVLSIFLSQFLGSETN